MTTAEVAARIQEVDDRLGDLSETITDLSTRLQDRETAHGELRDELVGRLSGVRSDDAPTRDQVDSRIHEALEPLHDEVHTLRGQLAAVESPSGSGIEASSSARLDGILARLEEAERKLAAVDADALTTKVAAELHPSFSALRKRMDELAEKVADPDPVSATLAEDHLADQVQVHVERALRNPERSDGVLARTDQLQLEVENLTERADSLANAFHEMRSVVGRQPAETAGSAWAAPAVAHVTAHAARHGLGAARKVLQLMRLVTHIGKDRQADMGQGGKFKFRGIDEAMDAVGHAMREVGLILSPEVLKEESSTTPVTKKGNGQNGPYESTVLWTTTKTTMRYTFVDPDDGSTHVIEMVGEGRDASDKSTSKAGSMAFKYALLQALCIPTTGLDDSDAAPPQIMENERDAPAARPAQRPQQQAAPQRTEQEKAQRAGEALQAIRNVYRVAGGPQAQSQRLVQIMNRVKSEGLLDFGVEGSTLNQHGEAAMRTLQAPPPPDDARASTEPPEPPDHEGGY